MENTPKLPTNHKMVNGIERLQTCETLHRAREEMTETGKKVVDDFIQVLDDVKDEIEEKNDGEIVQEAAQHAMRAQRLQRDQRHQLSSVTSTYQSHLIDLSTSLSDLIRVLFKSGETKTMIKEMIIWIIQTWDDEDEYEGDNTYQSTTWQVDQSGKHNKVTNEDTVFHKVANKVPSDTRYQLSSRAKETLKRVSSKSEYQDASGHLLSTINAVLKKAKRDATALREHKEDIIVTEAQSEAKQSLKLTRTFLERCANNASLDPTITSMNHLTKQLAHDDEFMHLWDNLYQKSQTWVKEPHQASSTTLKSYYNDIWEKLDRDYSELWNDFLENLKEWFGNFKTDPTHTKLASDVQKMINDAFIDENGNWTIKEEMLKDTGVLIRYIADQIAYINVPKITHDDGKYFFELDNISVKANNLYPKYVSVVAKGEYDAQAGGNASVLVKVSRIHASGKDISYTVKKKRGLFRFSDNGLVDFDINSRAGISATIELAPYRKPDGTKSIAVKHCDCYIDSLNLRLHDSKHNFLAKRLRKPISKMAQKNAEKVMCQQIESIFTSIFDQQDGIDDYDNRNGH